VVFANTVKFVVDAEPEQKSILATSSLLIQRVLISLKFYASNNTHIFVWFQVNERFPAKIASINGSEN